MYLQTLKSVVDSCGTDICYIQSVAYHASQKLCKSYHPVKLIETIDELKRTKAVSPEGWVNSLWDVATAFGFKVKYAKKAPADYEAADNEIEIQKWVWVSARSGKRYTHFVAAKKGIIIHDPEGNSNVCKYGYLHSKRIIGL